MRTRRLTLIELITTLIIISVMATYTTVKLSSIDRAVAIKNAQSLFCNDFRHIQSLAISNDDSTKAWQLQIEPNGYTILQNSGPSPINFPNSDNATRSFADINYSSTTETIEFSQFANVGSSDIEVTISSTDGTASKTLTISPQGVISK